MIPYDCRKDKIRIGLLSKSGCDNYEYGFFLKKNQIKDYDYSPIIRQPFVKWILQNIELFVEGNT